MKKKLLSLSVMLASACSSVAWAAPDTSKMYGAAAPFTIEKLPASRIKSQLERLPPAAQKKALTWLHNFDFPQQDLAFLRVDDSGAVFYEETVLPEHITQSDLEADPTLEGIDPVDAFKLHSKPGAANVVYVNFTGFDFSGRGWGGGASYQAQAFDKDNNPNTFSNSERQEIAEIWHRIAEDYAPFDIDVTTEAPSAFGPKVGHLLITKSIDKTGSAMPSSGAGGVAYVGVWGASYFESYQPALVYYDNLGSAPQYISEAASHELGHNLNLSHDGTDTVGYYTGHGDGFSSWAPIMGVGYYKNVTQWSKGEYTNANNTQDDIAIIDNKLGLREDDHSDTKVDATELDSDANGYIASSNPEFDPKNVRPVNKGIIETRSDIDVFSFETGPGDIELLINPAWDAFTRSSKRGANLHVKAALYDDYNNLIAEDVVIDDTNAMINANVIAGRYYLEISGVDNPTIPYSDYGSLGQYYVMGALVPVSLDNQPPSQPTLFGGDTTRTSIALSSSVATDNSGVVEYQFICNSGGIGCVAGPWQSSTNYIATNLASNSSYTYQVKARDNSGNETDLSNQVTMSTDSNIAPTSLDDSAETVESTAVTINVLDNDSDLDGDALSILSVGLAQSGSVSNTNSSVSYTPNTNFIGADSFSYTISDGFGGTSTSVVSVTVNAAPPSAPSAPSNLSAQVIKTGKGKNKVISSAEISWVDTANNETGFVIERCQQQTSGKGKNRVSVCNFSQYQSVGADTTRLTIPTESGYRYRVKAFNDTGDSAYSNEVSI